MRLRDHKEDSVEVRSADRDDREDILTLVRGVMGDDDAALVETVWSSKWYLPDLDLVAAAGEKIVGHALHGLGVVDGVEAPALAPLCVAVDLQRQGIGSRLVEEATRRADASGYPFVVVTGHWDYYPRLGFEPAIPLGILPRDLSAFRDTRAFMLRRLRSYAGEVGTFLYSWERPG